MNESNLLRHLECILKGTMKFCFHLKEPVNENSPHFLIDVRLMVHISGGNTARNLHKLTIIKDLKVTILND